jgi:hypothetical protein
MTTTSPHTKPAVAAVIGVIVGVLTLLEGYFGSGHIPSGAEVASILSGAGITLGSVTAYIVSHLGITRALVAVAPHQGISGSLADVGVLPSPAVPVVPAAAPAAAGGAPAAV